MIRLTAHQHGGIVCVYPSLAMVSLPSLNLDVFDFKGINHVLSPVLSRFFSG